MEATLKEGTRHVYHKRVFYIDEDSWSIAVVDNYDARLEIWRVQEAHQINYYDRKLVGPTMEVVYDLQNGRYVALGMTNEGRVELQREVPHRYVHARRRSAGWDAAKQTVCQEAAESVSLR